MPAHIPGSKEEALYRVRKIQILSYVLDSVMRILGGNGGDGKSPKITHIAGDMGVIRSRKIMSFDDILRCSKGDILQYLRDLFIEIDVNNVPQLFNILLRGNVKILGSLVDYSLIKNKEDLMQLENVILFSDYNVLQDLLLKIQDYDIDKRKEILLANCYVRNKKYLNLGKFHYKQPSPQDLFALSKYKAGISENNPYISHGVSQGDPFSLLDLSYVEGHTWSQQISRVKQMQEQIFFSLSPGNMASPEIQLCINRIFAPFFPMTRAIRLMNESGENVHVSVDVKRDISGKEISGFIPETSPKIKDFYRFLYQFLVFDFDRNSPESHNITKDGIMYDFNYIWRSFGMRSEEDFFDVFSEPKFYEEFKDVFFILKNYIHFYCEEEIARYIGRLETPAIGAEEYQEIQEKIEALKRLLNNEKSFTMTNLVSYLQVNKRSVLKFAYEADMEHAVGGYASRGVMEKIRGEALSVFLGR